MNTDAARAREAARQRDGKFGKQARSSASTQLAQVHVEVEPDGTQVRSYLDADGQLHADDCPALERTAPDGSVTRMWCQHGVVHREGGPAWQEFGPDHRVVAESHYIDGQPANGTDGYPHSTTYYPGSGAARTRQWVNAEGDLDRDDGPAYILYNPDGSIEAEEYFKDGKPLDSDITRRLAFQKPYRTKPAGIYGQRGWTIGADVKGILGDKIDRRLDEFYGKDDPDNPVIDFARFDDLDADQTRRLREVLPKENLEDRQNSGPTAGSILDAAEAHPGKVTPFGYVIGPDRHDERVSFEGFTYRPAPGEDVSWPSLERKLGLDSMDAPDEFTQRADGSYHVWWD